MPKALHFLSICLGLLAAMPAARAIELIDPAALGFGPPAFTLDTTYQATLDYDRGEGGYRWSDRLDLAAGVFASYGLDETQVMGAVGFIWRPNDQWIVQATPPVVAIGWQPGPDWTLALVAYPGGSSWEVAETSEGVRQVELNLWRAAASVEKRIGEHWRVSVRGGVSFGGELELRDANSREISSTDLEPAAFGAVAVKWSF